MRRTPNFPCEPLPLLLYCRQLGLYTQNLERKVVALAEEGACPMALVSPPSPNSCTVVRRLELLYDIK